MHKRLFPKVNQFTYGIYYCDLDLDNLETISINRNRLGLHSFYDRDHGAKDGSDLKAWITDILKEHNIEIDGTIRLVTLPRVLGYVFNPVSFWLCYDRADNLRAVLYEVNNTFGETHSYLIANDNHQPIKKDDVITARKLFHVSPFLEREGHYEFRIDARDDKFAVWIDFYDGKGAKKLVTALNGSYETMTEKNMRSMFWRYPLVTLKSIILIHWQAIKLVFKKARYVPKPQQIEPKISQSDK